MLPAPFLRRRVVWVLAVLFGLAGAARAQVSGVSYTLSPLAERIQFDDDAGLENDLLYGGKLGFGFGEFFELGGVFLFNNQLRTDFGDFGQVDPITRDLLGALPRRDVRFRRFGGDLKLNIGRGSLFPYVMVGTGLVQMDPEGLGASETIYVSGGVGVQFQLQDRYTVMVQASSLSYRYNPATTLLSENDLMDVGLTADELGQVNVNNVGIGAGLSLYLGGRGRGELTELDRALQEQLQGGLRGLRLQLAPMVATVDFDEETGFRDNQRLVGGSAGVDVGPYLGLRGFYWRGVTDERWTETEALQAYGGELAFRFATFDRGLTPYLLLGGGFLDVGEDYQGNAARAPEDRPFALGGGGVQFPLGRALRLHGGVRALLITTDDLANAGDPSRVTASWAYSAGVTFGLGGRSNPNAVADAAGRAVEAERLRGADARTRIEVELAQAQARIDSLEAALAGRPIPTASAPALSPAAPRLAADTAAALPAASQANGALPAGTDNPRWVTVPVPEEGEFYIRFGTPGGVSVETLTGDAVVIDPATGEVLSPAPGTANAAGRPGTTPAGSLTTDQLVALIQQTVRQELAAGTPPGGQAATEATRRLERRLAEMEARLLDARLSGRPIVVPVDAAGDGVVDLGGGPSTRFSGIYPVTGVTLGESVVPLLGVRGEFRQRGRSYRYLPEVVLGFGADELTMAINANAAFGLRAAFLRGVEPYAGGGLGFVNVDGLELVLNLLVGAERTFGFGRLFAEYGTRDFFDQNLLLAGYRIGF